MMALPRLLILNLGMIGILSINGCALDAKNASIPEVSAATEHHVDSQQQQWNGPELISRRYRTLFFGYDTVYYRLSAKQATNATPQYQLLIDINYGSKTKRDYSLAKLTADKILPITTRNHETMRCDFFNSMVFACLFRDRATIDLTMADLQIGATQGLSVQLSSKDAAYDHFDVPAAYIAGVMQAIEQPSTGH